MAEQAAPVTHPATEPAADDVTLLATIPEKALRETWKHAVAHNITNSAEDKRKILARDWPAGCVLTDIASASTTTKRGKAPRAYPRKGVIKLQGDKKASKTKIGLHQLAAYIRDGRMPKIGEQASHYACDNDRCINPGHIVFEPDQANGTRYCCKVYKDSPHYRCPHQPTCPGALSCTDA